MANVDFNQTSEVTAQLTVNITKEELDGELKEELKKARKSTNLKGFRPGKAPLSTLRKMMGDGILGQILDRKINDTLFTYLEEEEIDVIFSPLPAEDQEKVDIDARRVGDVSLRYDLALRPDFEIALPEEPVEIAVLDVTDEFIDERIDRLRRQNGENQEVKTDIQDKDVLVVEVLIDPEADFSELTDEEDDDIGDAGAENGESGESEADEADEADEGDESAIDEDFDEAEELPVTTRLYLDSLKDALREELLGKDVGYVTEVDPREIEKEASEKYIKNYLLDIPEEEEIPATVRLRVNEIGRVTPAELDEEFFKKIDDSGEVKDEAALREMIRKDNASGFNAEGENIANVKIQRYLVEHTEIDLPQDFLKRVHDQGQQSFDRFERGVRWMLIRGEHLKANELQIAPEDIREQTAKRLSQMMGGQRASWMNDDFLDSYTKRMMEDEDQRNELIYAATEKLVMDDLRTKVPLQELPLEPEAFNAYIDEFNKTFAEEEE